MEKLYTAQSSKSRWPSDRRSAMPLTHCVFLEIAYRVNGVAKENLPPRWTNNAKTFEFFADLASAERYVQERKSTQRKYQINIAGDVTSIPALVYEEIVDAEVVTATEIGAR